MWEKTIVPTLDKPSYRVVELKKPQTTRTELYLIRTNNGEIVPSTDGEIGPSGSKPDPSLSLSLRAMDLPFDSTKAYILVGSSSGVLCFYFKDLNRFILWNPTSGLICSIGCPDDSCLAFGFFSSLTSNTELIILGLTTSVNSRTISTFRKYSTETSRWEEISEFRNDSREGMIRGPGFVAGKNIYWAGYRGNSKLDSVVMFDIRLALLSVIPINAPSTDPYDFFCLLTHVTLVESITYFVLQRRTSHCTELLRLEGRDILVFICTTSPASYIIDLVGPDKLLVHSGDKLEMRGRDMSLISCCSFSETYLCPFVVLHSPRDEDFPSLKVYAEKNQKRTFTSKLKSAFGFRSGQRSPLRRVMSMRI